jgi:hypothetical protein
LLREAGRTAGSRSKDHGNNAPHRRGAVTAKRAKRSVAAAKRLDGVEPMWPGVATSAQTVAAHPY